MGIPKMDARFAARMATGLSLAILSLAGLRGEAFAQYSPPGLYTPVPSPYRQAPVPLDDDEDLPPYPAPGPYGRPSNAPYPYGTPQRPPSGIQSEALPPPGPAPYGGGAYREGGLPPPPGPAPYSGGAYREGGLPPPPGRGYSYGNWEPLRPPGDVYAPNERPLPPGPPGPGVPSDYANR